jgi:hypothetical protein
MSDERDMPAFPHPGVAGDFTIQKSHLGMTMRDYLAAQALASGLCRDNVPEYALNMYFGKHRTSIKREEIIAAEAYCIADAMLKARQ